MMLTDGTPMEKHMCGNTRVLVKREDLCCPHPGPGFSKMRGVVAHIAKRPEHVIGALDTFHSKAGWAVAWACQKFGKQCVDFWPAYKTDQWEVGDPMPRPQQHEAQALGANMQHLKAGRSAILYHQAKKLLAKHCPDSYMVPNALKLPESIKENAEEVKRTMGLPNSGTLVISISSGTVASGVLKGFHDMGILGDFGVVLHMGYSRSQDATRHYMEKISGIALPLCTTFVDEGYSYKAEAKVECPFPCNSHYDLKAWKWLLEHGDTLHKPVVFWNIGD